MGEHSFSGLQTLRCDDLLSVVRGRHGWFLANRHDAYIGAALLMYGEYSELEWHLLERMVFSDKDVIEVGANIGTHSVPLARKLSEIGRRLLVVEPQPVIFQSLCANLALNGLLNVSAENVACSDAPGQLRFVEPDYRQPANFGGVAMLEAAEAGRVVRCVRLDDIVPAEFDVGLIKIDVEGFEQKVITGAEKTIRRCRPFLYLENDRLEKSRALIEALWALDYALWWHRPLLFNPNNYAGVAENVYGAVRSLNMLAIPRETPAEIGGLTPVVDAAFHPLGSA